MFAEIAVPVYVHQTFTYALPASFAAQAQPGCRVLVPFGKQLLTGYIVDIHETLEEAGVDAETTEVKTVEELFDTEPLVTQELLELSKWIADYYYAPWGEVIKCCLPTGINSEAETFISVTEQGRAALEEARAKSSARLQNSTKMQALAFTLANLGEDGLLNVRELAKEFDKTRSAAIVRELERAGFAIVTRQMQDAAVKPKRQQAVRLIERAPIEGSQPLTDQQQRVINELFFSPEPVSLASLLESANVSASVIRTLEKRKMVEVFTREVRRNPLAHLNGHSEDSLTLTPKQQAALDEIVTELDKRHYAAFLLHGVTGSGKTEVYMRAMRAAVEQGRTALMLVPEISLTPMFARRLRAHFGDAVAILHSSLSEGERLDEWNRLRRGEALVCIGARSAVFAPLDNIGVIIVDEEHESSYKQDESPRYHGRDTAIMRAAKAGAVIILGSATPSMESYHNAHSGKYKYLKLDERIGGRALANVEVVDMREVFTRHGKQ
ncbi:MAG TPA: primosomal protein N', partial [Blastocatellia bacterium]|nr:primosomal protein N' [Blastocatellia bacterium]